MATSLPTTLAVALATIGTAACGNGDDAGPPPEPHVRGVRLVVVQSQTDGRQRVFNGTSRAGMENKLSFKVGGTVKQVDVKVGDKVEPGQAIASLDPADFELQVQEARASAAQASAESRNARAAYNRTRSLYEANSVSRAELDAARARSSSAGAMVAAASKRVQLAKSQVEYTRLTSALSGYVSAVSIEVNENVSPGQPVVVIASGGRPEVTIGVPEALISRIQRELPATVRFDAIAGRVFEASVIEVGVAPDPAGVTFPVAVRLKREDPAVRPGMAAEVELQLGSDADDTGPRFIVPPAAVAEDREGRFVYLVDPADSGFGTTRRVSVSIGDLTTDGLEVTSGIAAGDRLVTAGVSKISDGQRVRIPAAVSGGAAAPAAPASPDATKTGTAP